MSEYTAAICTIAGRLDVIKPGWRRQIDQPSLDMMDSQHCVLGQLFGGWGKAFTELHLPFFVEGDEDGSGYSPYAVATSDDSPANLTEWLGVINEPDPLV